MVLNKSAKVQTDKCNNILSKIKNSKYSRLLVIECTVNKLQTVNWVGWKLCVAFLQEQSLCITPRYVYISRGRSSRYRARDFRQLNSHPAWLSLLLSPYPRYLPRFPASFPRKISHARLYSEHCVVCWLGQQVDVSLSTTDEWHQFILRVALHVLLAGVTVCL